MTNTSNVEAHKCLAVQVAPDKCTECGNFRNRCVNDKDTVVFSCLTKSKPSTELVLMRHKEVRRTVNKVPMSYIDAFLKENHNTIKKYAMSFFKNDKSHNAKMLRKVGYIYEDVFSYCQVWAVAFLAPRVDKEFVPDQVDIKSLGRYLRQRFVEMYNSARRQATSCEIEGTAHNDDIELASISQATRQDQEELSRSRNKALRPKAARQKIVEKLACKTHEEAVEILDGFDNEDNRSIAVKIKETIKKCTEKALCPLCQAKRRVSGQTNIEYPPQQVGPVDVRNFLEETLSVGKCNYGSLAMAASKRRYRCDLISAARMLGLLSANADGSFSPTERAYKLCASEKGSTTEKDLFRVYVGTSNTLKPYKLLDPLSLAPYTIARADENPEDTSAAYYHYSWQLLQLGLSASTAHRRTSTLIMWRRFLQGITTKKVITKEIVEKPFRTIAPPPPAPPCIEAMFREQSKFRQMAF